MSFYKVSSIFRWWSRWIIIPPNSWIIPYFSTWAKNLLIHLIFSDLFWFLFIQHLIHMSIHFVCATHFCFNCCFNRWPSWSLRKCEVLNTDLNAKSVLLLAILVLVTILFAKQVLSYCMVTLEWFCQFPCSDIDVYLPAQVC